MASIGGRQQWMDFTRGLCVLLVMFLHASWPTRDIAGLTFSNAITVFNEFMDPFRIPLLVFLSGMLLHKSFGKTTSDYIRGKFNLIFWPFLIWSMVVYAAEGRLTLEYILKTPISAPSVLWYLWFLWAFYMLALVLVRRSIPLLPVIAVSLIASAFLPDLVRMNRFAFLFGFFLLGNLAATKSTANKITPLLAGLGLAAAVAGGVTSATFGAIKYDLLYIWVPLGLVAFVLWGAKFFVSSRMTRPLEWIGRNSIVFYVVHVPVMATAANLLGSGSGLDGTAVYLGLFGLAVLGGVSVVVLRDRFTIVGALFDFRKVLTLAGGDAKKEPRPNVAP